VGWLGMLLELIFVDLLWQGLVVIGEFLRGDRWINMKRK
jgi:hypothetical protein